MTCCPSCGSEIPTSHRFCGACGRAVPATSAPTQTEGIGEPVVLEADVTADNSFGSPDRTRFLPGALLAGRYRIFGLMGRGGMGEVYRADDLKLGQPVALKFLPPGLDRDPGRLRRFLNEVKVARQVSHPNVCRVYDVQEIDSQHFLSMEYVDGEDLASLLRRIGRLPGDKAVQIARQLCAGLAAAHEQGILHRDLKPSNVMIDGRGRAKIADFGLAELAEEVRGDDVGAGTPAYMAPEQLEGSEVTLRSDLYALGLVLYELFTGKHAFDAASPAERVRLRQGSTPSPPSIHVSGLDAAVERVVMRCLEKDPRNRPASALAVAASFPGGDPLAAALAAGETPSPEMVAAAGGEGRLRTGVAVACLAFTLAGIGLALLLSNDNLLSLVPAGKSPEVLADRAREVIAKLGYTDTPVDSEYGIFHDQFYLRVIEREDTSPRRWSFLAKGQPPVIGLWYRQSPRRLIPENESGVVTQSDPPRGVSGMVNVVLDSRGRLIEFLAVPPEFDPSSDPGPRPDWQVLLAEAGLDLAKFTPVRPDWVPVDYADSRAAWEGVYPDNPEVKMRVEAGAYRGRPVFFEIVNPWTRPWRMEEFQPWPTPADRILNAVFLVVFVSVLLGAVVLARHNLRNGRGDPKGAFKVGLFVFLVWIVSWVLLASHVPDLQELNLFIRAASGASFLACLVWLCYLALEPSVRRQWPTSIVSWNRLLGGRFRDALIGRDLVLGGTGGVVILLLFVLSEASSSWLGLPGRMPLLMDEESLLGGRHLVGRLIDVSLVSVAIPILLLTLLMLLKVILRNQRLAMGVFVAFFAGWFWSSSSNAFVSITLGLALGTTLMVLLVRLGLLAACVAWLVSSLAMSFPLTPEYSAWYAGRGIAGLFVILAVVGYGFWLSVAGRPLLRQGTLDA